MADLIGKFEADGVVRGLVGSRDLHVDGGRGAKVENLSDDVGGLEKELNAGKFGRELAAQFIDVVGGRPAGAGLELDEDLAVAGADGAGVAVGEIDSGVGKADIVEDGLQIA